MALLLLNTEHRRHNSTNTDTRSHHFILIYPYEVSGDA